jgi:hypothetical protein
MKLQKQKLPVIKIPEIKLLCKNGHGECFFVLMVADTFTLGSHCISKLFYVSVVLSQHHSFYYYRSEGPAQVFLIVLTWLISEFGCKGRDMWKQITIAYDNMCHLNNLRVARQPLPLPGDLKFIWSDINKVIDDLHIKNHKDSSCRQQYNTDTLKKENPHFNTMACEQTFAWLSRHKHILCSMPKSHFHFYLHRMVMRRNKYISHCYSVGRRIVPVKNKKVWNKEKNWQLHQ